MTSPLGRFVVPVKPQEGGPMADRLIVKGAREHNLRSVDLDLPRDA